MHSLFPFLAGVLVLSAHAATVFDQYCEAIGLCADFLNGGAQATLAVVALRVGNFVLALVGACAVLAVVYGGIKLSASGGNDQAREDAKKIVFYALIGLLLASGAEFAVCLVWELVTATTGALIANPLLFCP